MVVVMACCCAWSHLGGGGAGKALDPTAKVMLMTPRGQRWQQRLAQDYAATSEGYILICGRYEGYDERILELVDEQISVGTMY